MDGMGRSSDTEIMLKVKAGELEKLGLLFERYKQALFAYFYRSTNRIHTSEDLVQNVFLRIIKYRQRFQGYGKFTTWMYQIARNVYLDHCMKDNLHSSDKEIVDCDMPDESTAENVYIQEETIKVLDDALNHLSDASREVLILSKYQKLAYKEIGEIMGCSEGTVKVRVYRALIELKKKYKALEVL
jgi:RNA polymerase sigma factor (sigma-70 family)